MQIYVDRTRRGIQTEERIQKEDLEKESILQWLVAEEDEEQEEKNERQGGSKKEEKDNKKSLSSQNKSKY